MRHIPQEEETELPVYRVPFGIGSLNFGLRNDGSVTLSGIDYCDLLRAELETIPTLNNLEIDHFNDEEIEFGERDLIETRSGTAIFPDGNSILGIKFDLYIPLRTQEEIVGRYFTPRIKTEHFRIHIRYPYHGPVTFVELINNEESSDPSTAVRIVREYIEDQLRRLPGNVIFVFVGPSPFHADLYIEGHKTPNLTNNTFECKQLDEIGYADITFRCCVDDIPTESDACEALFEKLERDLGLFYQIHRDDVEKSQQWSDIELISSSLVEHLNARSLRGRLRTLCRRGRDLKALHVSLTEFESDHILHEHYINRQYRKLSESNSDGFPNSFLESALGDRPIYPVRQMTELMSFCEKRRSEAVEWLIVIIAGLVGGIAGSFVTVLANSYL